MIYHILFMPYDARENIQVTLAFRPSFCLPSLPERDPKVNLEAMLSVVLDDVDCVNILVTLGIFSACLRRSSFNHQVETLISNVVAYVDNHLMELQGPTAVGVKLVCTILADSFVACDLAL